MIATCVLGAGALVAAGRAWQEKKECFTWCDVVKYVAKTGRNPIKFMPQALLEVMGRDAQPAKIRVGGIVGPFFYFAQDGDFISHVTSSRKYKRVNPLDFNYVPGADTLTRASGMKPFLEDFLEKSIWFQPSGEVHERQRELFLSFVPKFVTHDLQGEIYEHCATTLQQCIESNGAPTDLFDLLQEVVSIVQLHFISDYKLPEHWSVKDYCSVTNSAFGGMYSFARPSDEKTAKLVELTDDMLLRSGDKGLVYHMRENDTTNAPQERKKKELLHNLMAGLFLGQQSLANAGFWLALRLFSDKPASKQLLHELQANAGNLPLIIKEELRVHPPSSPFLMPFKALEDDVYNGTHIPKGSFVGMMPILVHLNEEIYRNAKHFDKDRFKDEVDERRASFQGRCPYGSGPAVPVADVHAAMRQNVRSHHANSESAQCPVGNQEYVPFGVGQATCPMQGFSISVISNLVMAIVRNWNVEIHDDHSLFEMPVEEHVTVDTGSRPVRSVRATFTPNLQKSSR